MGLCNTDKNMCMFKQRVTPLFSYHNFFNLFRSSGDYLIQTNKVLLHNISIHTQMKNAPYLCFYIRTLNHQSIIYKVYCIRILCKKNLYYGRKTTKLDA